MLKSVSKPRRTYSSITCFTVASLYEAGTKSSTMKLYNALELADASLYWYLLPWASVSQEIGSSLGSLIVATHNEVAIILYLSRLSFTTVVLFLRDIYVCHLSLLGILDVRTSCVPLVLQPHYLRPLSKIQY